MAELGQNLGRLFLPHHTSILPHLILTTTSEFIYAHYPILQRGKVIWLGWYSVKYSDKSDPETIQPLIILNFKNK